MLQVIGSGAGLAAGGLSKCFTEGTQIVVGAEYDESDIFVQYVTVNIEDVEVGDWVYSYDTASGETTQRQVTDIFVRESDHINYLTIADENGNIQVIETTDGHPFWVVTDEPDLSRAASNYSDGMYHGPLEVTGDGYWVEAKDLRAGDVFLGANCELSTLVVAERIEFDENIRVYNFSVDGNHNYFVIAQVTEFGQTCVLVHNADTILYRRGLGKHKIDDIADQCQKAKEAAKVKNIHGISVSETVPSKPARSAPISEVQKHFTVHDTPLAWDPGHKTIEFPEPVTPESVKLFYDIFRPGN